jgi:hypothetical protein
MIGLSNWLRCTHLAKEKINTTDPAFFSVAFLHLLI